VVPPELEGVHASTPLKTVQELLARHMEASALCAGHVGRQPSGPSGLGEVERPARQQAMTLSSLPDLGSLSPKRPMASGGRAKPASDTQVLSYFTTLTTDLPLLQKLNSGCVGPRILTAKHWSYTKNVLFELLAQADELEVWGPSLARLRAECDSGKALFNPQGRMMRGISESDSSVSVIMGSSGIDCVVTERSSSSSEDSSVSSAISAESDPVGGRRSGGKLGGHGSAGPLVELSYYSKESEPRVALSERTLLVQEEKRRSGILHAVVCNRTLGMQLALWTPSQPKTSSGVAISASRTRPRSQSMPEPWPGAASQYEPPPKHEPPPTTPSTELESLSACSPFTARTSQDDFFD